jgi:uncharacterized membrane protein YccC
MTTCTRAKRRYLVNLRYQLPHVGGIVALAAINGTIIVAITAWIMLFGINPRMTASISETFVYCIAGVLVVTSILSIIWSLRYTRSAAGLLHNVSTILKDLADGRRVETPVRFRADDAEFIALEKSMNSVIGMLKDDENLHRRVALALDALQEELRNGEVDIESAAAGMRSIINILNRGVI